jgi:hypothetical protein
MTRAQFYLPEEIYAKLNYLASVRKEPLAQIIRGYVEEGIERDRLALTGSPCKLLGLAELARKNEWRSTGLGDGSINHNTYVSKAVAEAIERIHQLYGKHC